MKLFRSRPCNRSAELDADSIKSALCERWLSQWTLLFALILFAVMAIPFWSGLVYTMDDLGGFHLPLRALYAQELKQGHILTWTPALFGGFYVAGEGQLGVFHPLHLLLYRCLDLRPAFCIEVLASYPILFLGTYLFLRASLRRRDAAMFGALAFTFTGFNLLHFMHVNAIAVVAHIPWLLLVIHRLAATDHWRQQILCMAAIALLIGSQLLLGYPQFVWFSVLTEGAYLAFLVRRELHPKPLLAYAAVGNLLGLMLGAVQLLPTLDVLSESVRDGISRESILAGSLHPWNLAQFVGPYLFRTRVVAFNTHELGIYVGAVPLLLAVWLLTNHTSLRSQSRFTLAVATFALVALVLAMGHWGHLYELQMMLPMVGKFRFPSRYVELFSLGVAALAAVGMGQLAQHIDHSEGQNARHWDRRQPLRQAGPILLVVASILIALVAPWLWGPEHLGNIRQIYTGPILFLSGLGLLMFAERGSRPALVGLALLTAIDLGCYGLSYSVLRHNETIASFAHMPDAPPGPNGQRILADVVNPQRLRAGNRVVLAGWNRIDGYAGLEPRKTVAYRSLASLQAAGVRWVARLPETENIAGLATHNDHWLEVPGPLPRIRLATRCRVSNNPADIFEKTPADVTPIVDHPLHLSRGRIGKIESIDERPGEIEVRVAARGKQLLTIAESYHSGWRTRIDGEPAAVERVDGNFFGCVVPPGKHDVVFAFQPKSLRDGMWITAAGLVIALVCVAVGLPSARGR